jgi:hypothetical protein
MDKKTAEVLYWISEHASESGRWFDLCSFLHEKGITPKQIAYARLFILPPHAGIGSGTTPEDNMQRRLTDDERGAVSVVMFWQRKLEAVGITASGQKVCEQMLHHNTTDGLPYVEPPLTDEDARQRPWVMGKYSESSFWQGPFILIRERSMGVRYVVENHKNGVVLSYTHVRRATAEEIAAAGREVTG